MPSFPESPVVDRREDYWLNGKVVKELDVKSYVWEADMTKVIPGSTGKGLYPWKDGSPTKDTVENAVIWQYNYELKRFQLHNDRKATIAKFICKSWLGRLRIYLIIMK